MSDHGIGPRGYWQRGPVGAPPAVPGAEPPRAAAGASPAPPPVPPPSGPPARVGGAVAALVGALASLAVPVLTVWGGVPLLAWLVNAPGIVFGVLAVARTHDPAEVERFIRYTWACTFVYLGLLLMIVVGLVALLALLWV